MFSPRPPFSNRRPATAARTRLAALGVVAAGLVIPTVVLAEDAPAPDTTPAAAAPLDDADAPIDDDAPADDDANQADPADDQPPADEPTTTTTTVPAPLPVAPSPDDADAAPTDDPSPVTTTAPDVNDDTEISDTAATPTSTTTTTVPAPAAPVGLDVTILPNRIQHVLATIRYLESRNTYGIPPNKGNASGAYQFIESTWNGFGGYQHAYQAPPAVQDERAVLDVQRFLDRFDGDVSMVPVMWYYPRAVREPELMDVVPKPQHGNRLTIREYQTRWMSVYAELSGEELPPVLTAAEAALRAGLPPDLTSTVAADVVLDDDGDRVDADDVSDELAIGEFSTVPDITLTFPVLGPSRLASLDCATDSNVDRPVVRIAVDGDQSIQIGRAPVHSDAETAGLCSDEAPGVVFGVKLQPVLAAADGVITDIDDEPGSGRPISMTVTSPDGTSIEYRGFNDDSPGTDDGDAPDHLRLTSLARVGGVVRAGQIIGFMGDSDPLPPSIRADVPTDATETLDPDAAAPHIRLTITDRDGRPVDALGPILDARARESCRVGIGGWSVPPSDGVFDPVTVETTDLHDDIDSEWVITGTGQVWASGWAAMINPVELCGFVPAEAYGPGVAGSTEWLPHWLPSYDLPTDLWIDLVLQDDATPDAFVLPG